jgi:pimeloyl-ACP methyl ester carboxylesterase
MGGMIAQLAAANHPEKCLSMNSIMSTSSRGSLPPGTPEATAVLTSQPEEDTREGRARHKVKSKKITGSPGHQASDEDLYAEMLADIDRSYHPQGQQRQYVSIMASGSRTWLLPKITVPTMVLHGDIDPLVPREAGIDTAALIPGSEYVEVEGMGHDVAPGLYDTIMGHMVRHANNNAS